MRSGRAVGAQVRTGNSRSTPLVEYPVVIASRRRPTRCSVEVPVVLVGARSCRASDGKFLSGRAMRALTVTRVFLGAKGLRRCFASLPRARDARAHVRKLCSGRTVLALAVASRHSFFRQSPVPVVGRARSAPLHREEVGGCHEGDAVGAPGIALFERDAVGRDASW